MKYLFWCANEHLSFRIPEFEAISNIFGLDLIWVHKSSEDPWVILDFPNEDFVQKILSRSISVKYCIELWGDGNTYEELFKRVKSYPSEKVEKYASKNRSFKIYCEAFMKKLSYEERISIIDRYSFLPLKGQVKMKNPDDIYSHFEFSGFDHNNLPETPHNLFFGRCIGSGQRHLITKYSIKSRLFIGNTTMEPTLSLLMANLAKVSKGDLVLDPFVGTGSLILAASEFGGYSFGGDIDYLMMHARTRPSRVGQKKRKKEESMRGNFEQYQLEKYYGDIIVADNSRPPWREIPWFKAIIADPPYGIREPTEKIGTLRENVSISEEHLPQHYPSKISYDLSEIIDDLLNFAATHLELGGRIAFWYPVNREEYNKKKLPSNSSLKLCANCEQILSSHTSRRLLVFEKINNQGCHSENVKTDRVDNKFREHFFNANSLTKKERKERIKEYGHLNLSKDEPQNEEKMST
ncbi:tRNA (guanine(10)-N(2))-methyltransferase homolog [Lepeophtheirus salmonis]|uniref:tRNA (guanine(10)-N(2))-methyltransferase homolog n=1 Tax=Lepeophtheirus salmonis TaxID=72036 RepID=UPI001AE0F20B|nr:tRNA (guanine(10)-N2)-methyltransferase homolog [Lepeophtheirus salmonis]